jgi:hypothetical protein
MIELPQNAVTQSWGQENRSSSPSHFPSPHSDELPPDAHADEKAQAARTTAAKVKLGPLERRQEEMVSNMGRPPKAKQTKSTKDPLDSILRSLRSFFNDSRGKGADPIR